MPARRRAITQFFFDSDHYFRYLDRVRARGITIPIVPGIMPVQNFKQTRAFAERCGTSVPDWLADRFDGLDDDAATRKLIAAAVAAEQVLDLVDRGVTDFHFYTMNRADLVYAICHLLGVPVRPRWSRRRDVQRASPKTVSRRGASCASRARRGASSCSTAPWARMIQDLKLGEAGYRGERFADWPSDLSGNNDILILSQPDAVRQLHLNYFRAGADIVSTNTFSSTADRPGRLRHAGLRRTSSTSTGARLAARPPTSPQREDGRPRFVAGAMGPTNRTASISPDVDNPGFRAVTFDELREAYGEQAKGLVEGGADLLLIETIFDTLNAKAAIYAIAELFEARGVRVPVMISGTITDRSGRTLSGQTPEAFWNSVAPRRAVLGRAQLRARRRRRCAPTSPSSRASPTR